MVRRLTSPRRAISQVRDLMEDFCPSTGPFPEMVSPLSGPYLLSHAACAPKEMSTHSPGSMHQHLGFRSSKWQTLINPPTDTSNTYFFFWDWISFLPSSFW